jgi:hypothetical protein
MIKELLKEGYNIFRRIIRFYLELFILLILISGCKSIPFKSVKEDQSFNDYLYKKVNHSDSKYFSCDQIDISMVSEETKSAKAKVFISRGKFIFVSINFMGFELARAEISPDSIKFINRISKTYYFGNIDKLDSLYYTGLSYAQIESLILKGICVEKDENKRQFNKHIFLKEDTIVFKSFYDNGFIINSFFDTKLYEPRKIEIVDGKYNFSFLGILDSYNDIGSYPDQMNFYIRKGNDSIHLFIKIGKISYNKFDNRNFDVNRKYREISF